MSILMQVKGVNFNNPKLPIGAYPANGLQSLYMMTDFFNQLTILDSKGQYPAIGVGDVTSNSQGVSFVDSYATTDLKLESEHTIFCVFKMPDTADTNHQSIVSSYPNSSRMYIRGNINLFNCNLDTGGGTSLLRGNIDRSRLNGNWVFCALSVKAGAQAMIIPQASFSFSANAPATGVIGSGSSAVTFGWDANYSLATPKLNGEIAVVGVYNKYMETPELMNIWEASKSILSTRGIDISKAI